MLDPIYSELKEKMTKSIDSLSKEMQKTRTGRANPNMLDSVKVDYYGTLTPLNQMSSISTPESKLITVQPWDITMIKNIEKGILKANLGLTPSNDGKIIRISIPPLTEERRKEIVKNIQKTCETYKVTIRNIRRDSNDLIKVMKTDGEITEDESFKALDEINKITNQFIEQVDEVYKKKQDEILEF